MELKRISELIRARAYLMARIEGLEKMSPGDLVVLDFGDPFILEITGKPELVSSLYNVALVSLKHSLKEINDEFKKNGVEV